MSRGEPIGLVDDRGCPVNDNVEDDLLYPIDELAYLSGCYRYHLNNDPVHDGWIIDDATLEKFANSIIRRCAEICTKQSLYYAENDKLEASGAAGCCGRLILQDFNVNFVQV